MKNILQSTYMLATKKTKNEEIDEKHRTPKISNEEIIKALEKDLPENQGKRSIKHLWTDQNSHRFRINWWESGKIINSVFVRILVDNERIEIIYDN